MIGLSPGQLESMKRTTAGNRPSNCTVYRPGKTKTPSGGWLNGTPGVVAKSRLRVSLQTNAGTEGIQGAVQTGKVEYLLALDPGTAVKPQDYVVETGTNRKFQVLSAQGPRSTSTETLVVATEDTP